MDTHTTAPNRIYLDTLDGVVMFTNCHAEAIAAYRAAASKAGAGRTILANRETKGLPISETMRINIRTYGKRAKTALEAIDCAECQILATAPRHSWHPAPVMP